MNIHPYLKFNDNKCKEAMTFYKECIGGELTFMTVGDSPMAKDMPKEAATKIMHATLKNGETELYASDMMRDKAIIGDNVTVSINTKDEEEAKRIFAGLSKGGEVFMPLEKAFWGALFGMVTDKYDIEWMVNCELK